MKKNVGWSLVLGLMALAGLQSCQLVAGAIEVAREGFPYGNQVA